MWLTYEKAFKLLLQIFYRNRRQFKYVDSITDTFELVDEINLNSSARRLNINQSVRPASAAIDVKGVFNRYFIMCSKWKWNNERVNFIYFFKSQLLQAIILVLRASRCFPKPCSHLELYDLTRISNYSGFIAIT